MAEICKHCNRPLNGPVDLPDPEPLMSVEQLSEYIQIPVLTLYAWRTNGRGPSGHRVGKYIRYRRSVVEEWLATRADDWTDVG